MWLLEAESWGEEELDEGGQKIQTVSYLFTFVCAGSSFRMWAFLVSVRRDYSSLRYTGFSSQCFSRGAQALGAWASVAVAHRLSCSVASGIFLDQ